MTEGNWLGLEKPDQIPARGPDLLFPAEKPEHHLPDPTLLPEGTLARCMECSRWFVKYTNYDVWVEYMWKPVRWWMFKARKRIQRSQS